MEAPLTCEGCGKPLDKIYNATDTYPVYGWDSTQLKYVLIDEGSSHMECAKCGSNIQSDYTFDLPDEFIIRHNDTTDSVEEEEVNVNGTIYTNAEIAESVADSVYLQYIQEQYKPLLERYPELEVTLLERGHNGDMFQDFCIEPKELAVDVGMPDIITWWRKNR